MMEQPILLITVVRRSRGDRVVSLVREAGATGSTVLLGRGIASNKLLSMLCLADTGKEIVFTIAPAKIMPPIIEVLRAAPDLCRNVPGFGFTVDVNYLTRTGVPYSGPAEDKEKMTTPQERQLICVIANEGFSDDIIHAAREAGARGGTIVQARGTGTKEDSSFFGITIVPEKEMVLILSATKDCEPILNAISKCPGLSEPGVGIVFTVPVSSFFPLGAKANKLDK